jgi:hypothetical protein
VNNASKGSAQNNAKLKHETTLKREIQNSKQQFVIPAKAGIQKTLTLPSF